MAGRLDVDPRVLAAPGGLDAVAADLGGRPTALVVAGEWRGVRIPPGLAHVPALTIALAPVRPDGPFDLWAPDHATADRWLTGFARAPRALLAAALLVRRPHPDVWGGLVAESTTYSLLQAGPEFGRWLASATRPAPAGDTAVPRVRVDRDAHGTVAEVVLTRPARHNALDAALRDQLHAALGGLALDPGVAAVTVRGEGPSFCSGGDLGEFGTAPGPVDAHVVRLARSLALRFHDLRDRLVVGLHGACLGAGIELAAFAGRVIAADDARIGLPEGGLGLVPGAGGTVSVPRRAGSGRLLELLVTGEPVDAATALAWGLVDEVVARDRLDDRLREVAALVAATRATAP